MMGDVGVVFSLFSMVLALVLIILGIFMPWFVYKICQETKEANRLLLKIVHSLNPEEAAKAAAKAAARADRPAVYR